MHDKYLLLQNKNLDSITIQQATEKEAKRQAELFKSESKAL